jgi:hypothetical protein
MADWRAFQRSIINWRGSQRVSRAGLHRSSVRHPPSLFCQGSARSEPTPAPSPYVHPFPPKVTQDDPRLRDQAEGRWAFQVPNATYQVPLLSKITLQPPGWQALRTTSRIVVFYSLLSRDVVRRRSGEHLLEKRKGWKFAHWRIVSPVKHYYWRTANGARWD